ncbi:MAG: alpha/beta fold hydrolase [Achromobacter sp.]|uniref:glycosyltransferase n=1 Tax=Achromobacter sp. TaxID=134375 RepID=UPI0012C4803B|nr:alpha/beta fold hydrolase [Achromobacter sp.]
MRILHTLAEPSLGGLEFRTLEQASWLQRHGHEVAIASPSDSAVSRAARERQLTTVDIDFKQAYSPSTILALRRAIKAMRIQVVDSHSRADGKTAALCRDLCAVVRTRHFAKPMRTSPRRRLEWNIGCDHVIATSSVGRQELLAARLVAEARISVVGEWAGDEFFRPADEPDAVLRIRHALDMPDAEEAYVVATVGMLRPEKGQADLLRVVQRLRARGVPAVGLVVGMATPATKAYAYELYRLAVELGISEHVVFAGHRSDVPDMIQAADVMLVPSAAEAWSRVVPESFAMRRPVVASDVGGLPEIVKPEHTGWLAAPGDVAAYVDCILQIRNQPAAAQAIVNHARAFADTHFRLEEKMHRTLEAYRLAMEPGGASQPGLSLLATRPKVLAAGGLAGADLLVCAQTGPREVDVMGKAIAGTPLSNAPPARSAERIEPLEILDHEVLFVGEGARGRTGILLVHGLTSTPQEMSVLARGLHLEGYTVLAVSLAGHSGTLPDLAKPGWLDWLASVRRGADVLASRVDRLIVGGLSAGAVLALALAQERPLHVAGVLALSPAFRHGRTGMPRAARLAILRPVLRILGLGLSRERAPLRIKDETLRGNVLSPQHAGEGGMGNSWGAALEMRKLATSVLRRMHNLRAPCLVLHARQDDVASLSGVLDVVRRARNTNVCLQVLGDGDRGMAMDREQRQVIARVAAFIHEIVDAPAQQEIDAGQGSGVSVA